MNLKLWLFAWRISIAVGRDGSSSGRSLEARRLWIMATSIRKPQEDIGSDHVPQNHPVRRARVPIEAGGRLTEDHGQPPTSRLYSKPDFYVQRTAMSFGHAAAVRMRKSHQPGAFPDHGHPGDDRQRFLLCRKRICQGLQGTRPQAHSNQTLHAKNRRQGRALHSDRLAGKGRMHGHIHRQRAGNHICRTGPTCTIAIALTEGKN